MKFMIASLVLSAGVATLASGQTVFDVDVSANGLNWSKSIAATPGATYQARVRVSYVGTSSPLGFASAVFQPTISNWDTTGAAAERDRLLPFVNNSVGSNNTTPLGVVQDLPGLYGRVSPFGRTAITTTGILTGHVQLQGPTTYLRLAQSYATDWFGTGNNLSRDGGISSAQLNDVGRTTADPAFNSSTVNVILFKWAVTLSTDPGGRSLVLDLPIEGFGNRGSNQGPPTARWFATMNEPTGQISESFSSIPASLDIIVPAPQSLAVCIVGLGMTRRRPARRR